MIERNPPPYGFVNWRPDVCADCEKLDPKIALWLAGYSWDELSLRVPCYSAEDWTRHKEAHRRD